MPKTNDPIDTHLLRVFCTLMVERSVSRTAIRLNQSQPAVSNSLKRLRDIFEDRLFSLDRGRLVPSERAVELHVSARLALGEIDKMLVGARHFEPERARLTFRIGTPDFLSVIFLTRFVERLRREAPHVNLIVRALGPDFDYQRALAEGELDVVIGNWPDPPANLHLAVLVEDKIVCVVSKNHPFARNGLSMEDYLRASHVVPMPYSVAQRGVVESHLASLNLSRNPTIVLPYFNLAMYLLPGTDLVFTTAKHFAQHFAGILPLSILPAPFDFPAMRFYLLWHERTHLTEGHVWVRGLMTAVARQQLASDAA